MLLLNIISCLIDDILYVVTSNLFLLSLVIYFHCHHIWNKCQSYGDNIFTTKKTIYTL